MHLLLAGILFSVECTLKRAEGLHFSAFHYYYYLLHVGTICYDDACHLYKHATNSDRSALTPTAERLAKMDYICCGLNAFSRSC